MLNRILKGWNVQRALFLAMGTYVIVASVMDRQLVTFLFGLYILSMALFDFGCASGKCYQAACASRNNYETGNNSEPIFEEIKEK
jgi:hypothetical protein